MPADLDAAAVSVHVAEAADVHEDVEAELLAGAEGAQHFVVLAAMAQAEVDDFAAVSLPEPAAPAVPGGKNVGMLVEQRGCDFDFERLFVQQIDDGF